MNVLMVGFNVTLLRAIDSGNLPYAVTVIEEPDLYHNKQLDKYSFSCLENVIFAEYQQSTDLLNVLEQATHDMQFHAVVPGLEYAVEAANHLARKLALPNAGPLAPAILTNKYLLRLHCEEQGIPHPRFAKVECLEDVLSFYKDSPIIIKPANRQASLGVVKVDTLNELEPSWHEVLSIDEGNQVANRTMKWEYIVEDCMEGCEISSEVLVSNGELVFYNCTDKTTTTGKYSVELGHVVPALLTESLETEVRNLMEKLLSSLNFDYGVLHAEWMITSEGPKLIECAARAPGDMIFQLIGLAYRFNPYQAFIEVMAGAKPTLPKKPCAGACIQFFEPKPGKVTEIRGLDVLRHPQVINWNLSVKKGDDVHVIRNSWDRCGNVVVSARNSTGARDLALELTKQVIIETS